MDRELVYIFPILIIILSFWRKTVLPFGRILLRIACQLASGQDSIIGLFQIILFRDTVPLCLWFSNFKLEMESLWKGIWNTKYLRSNVYLGSFKMKFSFNLIVFKILFFKSLAILNVCKFCFVSSRVSFRVRSHATA